MHWHRPSNGVSVCSYAHSTVVDVVGVHRPDSDHQAGRLGQPRSSCARLWSDDCGKERCRQDPTPLCYSNGWCCGQKRARSGSLRVSFWPFARVCAMQGHVRILGQTGSHRPRLKSALLTPMYGPAVRCKRLWSRLADAVLRQCIRSLIAACAPGHHGYQRAARQSGWKWSVNLDERASPGS